MQHRETGRHHTHAFHCCEEESGRGRTRFLQWRVRARARASCVREAHADAVTSTSACTERERERRALHGRPATHLHSVRGRLVRPRRDNALAVAVEAAVPVILACAHAKGVLLDRRRVLDHLRPAVDAQNDVPAPHAVRCTQYHSEKSALTQSRSLWRVRRALCEERWRRALRRPAAVARSSAALP